MDFAATPEQRALLAAARTFASQQLAPHAVRWDAKGLFPRDTIAAAARVGFCGLYIPEDVGGTALGALDGVHVFEGLSYGDPSIAAFISVHNMCALILDRHAPPELRRTWLQKLTTAEWLVSYCLTEPGCGSDASALATRATREGDEYVVTGSKAFITGGSSAGMLIVFCRTGGDGPDGISALVVESDAPGITLGRNERKMGWNAQPTCEIRFDGVRVPAANLLGREGQGYRIALQGLNTGRLNIAACSLGGAQCALDKALAYLNERQAYGEPLSALQSLRFKVAEMETELQAARTLVHCAAWMADQGLRESRHFCAMAKRFATDVCFRVANDALQIFGGYGYLAELGIEKIVRDLRVHQILEGSNEIMNVIIARELLDAPRDQPFLRLHSGTAWPAGRSATSATNLP